MNPKRTITGLCLLLGMPGAIIAAIPDQNAVPQVNYTLYKGATLIDGTGSPAKRDSSILVADDTIEAVYTDGRPLAASLPENTKVIDASNWYVTPGLIDTHVHLATAPDRPRAEGTMRRYLYSGITSVRDMAGDGRALADLARASLVQKIEAPDLYYSALMAGPSFFTDPRTVASAQGVVPGQVPWMQAIDDNTDVSEAVSLARGSSATGIKIYANLQSNLVREISAEAREQGIQVWAHSMVFPATPGEVAAAKVDVMSHVCRLAFEAVEQKPSEYHHNISPDYSTLNLSHPGITAVMQKMKNEGIVLDATVRLYGELEQIRAEKPDPKATTPIKCPMSFAAQLTRIAFEAGVEVSAGTDGVTSFDNPFPALHEELELLVSEVGMTTLQAIRSATYAGALALGKEAELGSIEAGKKANMVFLQSNPVEDIANFRSVVLTVKRGNEYPRSAFKLLTENEAL